MAKSCKLIVLSSSDTRQTSARRLPFSGYGYNLAVRYAKKQPWADVFVQCGSDGFTLTTCRKGACSVGWDIAGPLTKAQKRLTEHFTRGRRVDESIAGLGRRKRKRSR